MLMSLFAQVAVAPDYAGLSLPVLNFYDFLPATEIPAIQARTSTYACDTAFVSAVAALPTKGGEIWFGPGKFKFNATLDLARPLTLSGVGLNSTALAFPANTTGIIGENAAGGSIIARMQVLGTRSGSTSGHGIQMLSPLTLQDVQVSSFAEDGVHIVAGTPSHNANHWKIIDGGADSCGGNGLYVDGSDVNVGICVGFSAKANGGWGVLDSSFLGNTYVGCHTASNILGPYKTDSNNANNEFIGCYAENGQGSGSNVIPPSIIRGGTFGVNTGGAQRYDSGSMSPVSITRNDGTRDYTLNLQKTTASLLELVAQGDDPRGWGLAFWHEADKTWQFRHAHLDARVAFSLTTNLGTQTDEAGVLLGAGKMLMNGVWASAGSGKYRYIDFKGLDDRLKALGG